MNNVYGITRLKVEFFAVPDAAELNRFLQEHNGEIVDIQFGAVGRVMVVYKEETIQNV